MKRGLTISRETERGQQLSRVMITRRYDLAHAADTCLGCGLCADVCPKGAVALGPAAVVHGRLETRPLPLLDAGKCNFCGECVVTCPSHSLDLRIDGVARLLVVEGEAFPRLIAAVEVAVERCRPDCGLACAQACPVDAVAVSAQTADGRVEAITAVDVDENKCFYCGACEVACSAEGALRVRKPMSGAVVLNANRCPEGCQACADACPSGAIAVAAPKGLTVDERNCFYCGACARVCPVEGALAVHRNRVSHTPVKSAAWTAALGKILSPAAQAREMEAKARRRAREAAAGLLGIE